MQSTSKIIQDMRQAGLTQTEIAKRSGVPQCRLSRWERGVGVKAPDDALKLVDLHRELALAANDVSTDAGA